jgi:hypothetical protein
MRWPARRHRRAIDEGAGLAGGVEQGAIEPVRIEAVTDGVTEGGGAGLDVATGGGTRRPAGR